MKLSFITKPRVDKSQLYIILRYHYKTTQTDFSTGIICNKKNWIKGRNSSPIRPTEVNGMGKNELLRIFKQKLEQIIFKLQSDNIEPTGKNLKKYHELNESKVSIRTKIEEDMDTYSLQFLTDEYLKSIESAKTLSDPKSNRYRIGIIKSFLKDTFKGDVFYQDINEEFCGKLFDYLFNKKLSNTTSVKIYQQLRVLINWSYKRKYISSNIIEYKHNLNTKYKEVHSLTLEQLNTLFEYKGFDYGDNLDKEKFKSFGSNSYIIKVPKLINVLDEKGKVKRDKNFNPITTIVEDEYHYWTVLEVIKDMFLFSCSTGLRYSDLIRLKVESYNYEKKSFPIIQKKTQKPVNIIENPLSKYIFQKYSKNRRSKEYLFPLNCKNEEKSRDNYNTKCNKLLKDIFVKIEIDNNVLVRKVIGRGSPIESKPPLSSVISFHVGRKTYSTIANMLGIDPFSLSSAMGHQGLEMTKNYVKVYDDKLKNMFDFVKDDDKKEEEKMVDIIVKNIKNDSLESKLDRLKTLRDDGRLPEDVYLQHINNLLKENGL